MVETTAANAKISRWIVLGTIFLGLISVPATPSSSGSLLIAYGGFNETMAPLWIGIERGLFRKYGVDVA